MRRLLSLILSLLMAAAVLTGCSSFTVTQEKGAAPANLAPAKPAGTQYPLTLKDGAGREVTIAAEPRRILSLAPSNTELVFALGKGDRVVGRTDFCDYPAEVSKIESVGGIFKPNYEKMISLKPDLVLMISGTEEIRNRLANEHKLTVFVVDPQNFAQLYEGIAQLGQVLNAGEKAAALTAEMQAEVRSVTARVAVATVKPKVFYEVWHDPLMTAGPDTFIDDLIRLAGGQNAAADAKERWATYSLEQLAANNPDIIVTSADQAGQVAARKGWSGIKAVKESRVAGVADQNIIVRPGPRLVQGLLWFARTLHPELFK